MWSRLTALGVCAVALAWLTPSTVLAGNVDSFYLGNDAALQAGAITADAGSGAIWYNPAGLAGETGLRLDASANAYSVRFGGHPDFEGSTRSTEVTHLSNVDFSVVPTALTVTRGYGQFGIGLGVFVPTQQTTVLRTRIVEPPTATQPGIDFGLDYREEVQEYLAGMLFALRLHPAVDIGGSLLGHFRSRSATGALQLSLSTAEGAAAAASLYEALDWQQFGQQLALGVRLRPAAGWKVGMVLRFPTMRHYQVKQVVSMGSSPGAPAEDEFREEFGLATGLMSPGRFHAGVSREAGPVRLAVDFSYQTPLSRGQDEGDLVAVLNGRVGARYRVSDTVALGGGVFSDRSPRERPRQFGEVRLHYYGATLAADISNRYVVREQDGDKTEEPASMAFGTTVALTYAVGRGEMVRGAIGGPELYREALGDVTAHEVMLHVGSTLMR